LPPSEEPVPPASDEPANVVAPDAEPIFEEPAEREPEMSPVAPEPAGNGVANEIRSFPPRRPGTIPVAPSGGPRVGGPARPPEPRPLDDAPPIQPGHGHSTHEAPGSSRAPASYRAVTYVSPAPPAEPQPRGPERGEQNENREIARAAVARVMELERAEQRNPTELPHNNPGYDVESRDGDDIRYIEVKGTAGSWPVAGVAVSDSQFNKAWTEGERYWLYVVEYALDDERARIHRIQNPTGAITEYRFDPGWRALGEGDTAPLRPEKGRRVRLPNGMVDEILAVEGADQVLLMQLRDHPERIPFEPGTMVVLSEEK